MSYNISKMDIEKITDQINKFSEFMCNIVKGYYFNKLNELHIKCRNSKITFYDAIIHKLLYTREGKPFTKQQCANTINFTKKN